MTINKSKEENTSSKDSVVVTSIGIKPTCINSVPTLSNVEFSEEVDALISDEALSCTKAYYNKGQVALFAPVIVEIKSLLGLPTHPKSQPHDPASGTFLSDDGLSVVISRNPLQLKSEYYLTDFSKFTFSGAHTLYIKLCCDLTITVKEGKYVKSMTFTRDSSLEVAAKSSGKYSLAYWICCCGFKEGLCSCPKPCGQPIDVKSETVYYRQNGTRSDLMQFYNVKCNETNDVLVARMNIEAE